MYMADNIITLKGGQRILVTNAILPYFPARKLANKLGGKLISAIPLDECLMGKKDGNSQLKDSPGAFACQVVAYLKMNASFEGGEDIVSPYGWILQAKYIPEDALGKPNTCLVIDAADEKIEHMGGKTYFHPEKEDIVSVENFLHGHNAKGKLDPATGIVQVCNSRSLDAKFQRKIRFSYTCEAGGIFPIYRYCNQSSEDFLREVHANLPHTIQSQVLVQLPSEEKSANTQGFSYDVRF